MTLIPGTKLDGYEILGSLGAGGMGEVYRARDPILKRDVAIKVLPAYFSQDPDRLRRFEQEAQAAAALNHPNLLAVHRFGTFEGAPYLVAELLDGGTLGQLLTRGPLPGRKAIDYGAQIARGLAAAHEKGIVHRDLKPDNIFVTKDGRVRILDFGLAKLTRLTAADGEDATLSHREGTDPGQVLGTVGYMSPEQVRGKLADHRADLFAFGAIFYEMLTGKRAFRKPTSTETMTAILNEEPTGISQVAPGTPPALLRIVHRCLEKYPEQRFHSASDLAFALESLSDSGSSSVAAVDQGSRSLWIWAVTAGVVVALAAALIAWWRVPPAVPVVESVTQLTDDGESKQGKLVSDGSRVYFNEGPTASWKIAQVSVSGGRTALVDTRISEIARTARERTILFHTDAAQSVGKISTVVDELGVDLLSLAGHKLYAPKGVGALYVRKGVQLEPLIHGASQESGRRAGTENIVFDIGLGAACELAQKWVGTDSIRRLSDLFWELLQARFGKRVVLNGHPIERLPNTLNVSFVDRIGSDILNRLPNLAASTGSACHSGSVDLSPVLKAMRVPSEIGIGAIRFSRGRTTTQREIEQTVELLSVTLGFD